MPDNGTHSSVSCTCDRRILLVIRRFVETSEALFCAC